MHTDTASQEYLIKLPIGDRDFSFVIEILFFSFEFKFKTLFRCNFTLVCSPRCWWKGLFYVAKINIDFNGVHTGSVPRKSVQFYLRN